MSNRQGIRLLCDQGLIPDARTPDCPETLEIVLSGSSGAGMQKPKGTKNILRPSAIPL
jgi:hypothetical protein